MTTEQVLSHLIAGNEFTYESTRKKGRTLTIKAIIRTRPMCDLFLVKANDLKYASGTFNEETITPIIEAALSSKPQKEHRIR